MLQSLDLFGFKSFVDRTRFDFDPGITGIVGPNGSGKSNVVDAIKWILGDQSPKSMRGKEMTDVIFSGSSGRKAAGFAEATLTFDNSNRMLPIESTEVQIGRRIWQSGDSEYLINGETSRLKDVRNLFLGTGSSAYSIIEQGRVGAILQANPSTRRTVFEEAAGISRYKARRIEALRKLERVGQNLLRLTDIVDEVEAQLTATRNQAQKAARFRDVSAELREWRLGLAADDYREHSQRLESLERVVNDFSARIAELEAQKHRSEVALAEIDREVNGLDERTRTLESRRGGDREQIAALEATVSHQRRRSEELSGDAANLAGMLHKLQQRLQRSEESRTAAQAELDTFEKMFGETTAARDEAARELETVQRQVEMDRGRLDTIRRAHLEQARIVAACQEKVAALESRQGTLEIDRSELAERQAASAGQHEACRREYEQRQSRVAASKRELEEIEGHVARTRQARDQLLSLQTEAVKAVSAAREQRSAHQARIGVLEELERRQEGVGLGVREILQRAKTSPQAPWNLIRGSVSDLLEVDLEHAPLVDVALGEAAQWIVLDRMTPWGDYLLEHSGRLADRVGFIAADADPTIPADHDTPPATDLIGQPGVVGRVSEGVGSSEEDQWVIARLLAHTWIVDTLSDALRLSRGPGRGARFVTLQGELVERNGTLLAGPVSTDASPLSRRSELRRLRAELADLCARIDADESELGDLDESLVEAECDLSNASDHLADHATQVARLEAEARDQRRELEELARVQEGLAVESERLDQTTRSTAEELATAAEEQQTSARRQSELAAQASQIQESQSDLREERAARESTLDEARLEVTRQEERRGMLADAVQRRDQEVSRHTTEVDEAGRRLQQLGDQSVSLKLDILNAGSQLATLALADDRHAREIDILRDRRRDLRAKRSKLSTEDNRLLEEIGTYRQQQHAEELKASEIRIQFENLEERLQDEYQVGLADLKDSPHSAFQLHLAELRAESEEDQDRDDQDEGDLTGPADTPHDNEANQDEDAWADQADGAPTNVEAGRLTPPPGVSFDSVRDELEERVSRLRRKLQLMGSVNTDALEDLEELEDRYEHLETQRRDIAEAKATLEEIVRRIDEESQRLFRESFTTIREHFQEMFRKLFGGGESDIILEDPNDVLDCAIDILARPPGKELQSLSLLSGGEKTLTAVALVMAIFKSNPSPFCVLDEVDAALDDANIERYTAMLTEFAETTQFIMITHRKRTMTVANVIYGVTMEQPGVSKRMSVRFEDVSEDGDFASSSPDDATDAA